MAVSEAIIASTPGHAPNLKGFNREIVVKMELAGEGNWLLFGRVLLNNSDDDPQYATARLVHDANVVIDEYKEYISHHDPFTVFLRAGLQAKGNETVTLECDTYDGWARLGSIIALKVDTIEWQ